MSSSHIESCLECEHHDIVADWHTGVEKMPPVFAVVCSLRKDDPVEEDRGYLGDMQPCKIVASACPAKGLTNARVGIPSWCPLGLLSEHQKTIDL